VKELEDKKKKAVDKLEEYEYQQEKRNILFKVDRLINGKLNK